MVRSPVEICRGTNPSQAAKSRPLENTSPVPIVAIEMIGPIPSTVIRRTHAGSRSTKFVMSADKPSIRSSSRRLVTGQILDDGASCAARARQSVWQGCLAIRCAESAAPGATATPRSNGKERIWFGESIAKAIPECDFPRMRFRAWRRFGEAEKGVAAIAAGIAAGAAADLALGDVAADVVFRSVGGIRPLYQKTARFRY